MCRVQAASARADTATVLADGGEPEKRHKKSKKSKHKSKERHTKEELDEEAD